MTQYNSKQAELEAVRMTAMLMAASARTAPKTRGMDSTSTMVLDGEDVQKLADAMERKAASMPPATSGILSGNAKNVRVSSAVLLIGVTGEPKSVERPLDCGACGFDGCERLAKAPRRSKDFTGPTCVFQSMDLGIALGSAVKTAGILNVDNRMMYSIGVAAKEMKLLEADIIIGIPLSVSGKSPFFDRKP
jgi:uncharacterized ferredoxin-like protein